ncbi:hypothetical protein [Kineococcus auxinigenes]|uniref:hypothetical protein n=1 Tax=unclassified Kineococcus TaxID=2621656 RepID=UPI003D7D3935
MRVFAHDPPHGGYLLSTSPDRWRGGVVVGLISGVLKGAAVQKIVSRLAGGKRRS